MILSFWSNFKVNKFCKIHEHFIFSIIFQMFEDSDKGTESNASHAKQGYEKERREEQIQMLL